MSWGVVVVYVQIRAETYIIEMYTNHRGTMHIITYTTSAGIHSHRHVSSVYAFDLIKRLRAKNITFTHYFEE